MAEDFSTAVDYGLRLSKRIYYGKDRSASAPKPQEMEKSESQESFLPTAPMVYAVIPEPSIVDNPDVPSYQPYVHGRCDPPALIPLHMLGIAMEVDCYLDTAFISVSGTWRVHCVMGSRRCDCRVAIPMGEQVALVFLCLRFTLVVGKVASKDKENSDPLFSVPHQRRKESRKKGKTKN